MQIVRHELSDDPGSDRCILRVHWNNRIGAKETILWSLVANSDKGDKVRHFGYKLVEEEHCTQFMYIGEESRQENFVRDADLKARSIEIRFPRSVENQLGYPWHGKIVLSVDGRDVAEQKCLIDVPESPASATVKRHQKRPRPLSGRQGPPYTSASDIPFFREKYSQLLAMKVLTAFSAKQRKAVEELRAQLDSLADVVDRFYALLGPRHWVFHGHLHVPTISALLELDESHAERELINMYKSNDWLPMWVRGLGHDALLGEWRGFMDDALDDYSRGRYRSAVLGLIPVLDGYVNIVDQRRRGLHARGASEMQAWDSVVGHHQGLTSVMSVFTKPSHTLVTTPIIELHRHGIVHGMMTNFDNDVVATKAWNYLFAIVDWAKDLQRQSRPQPKTPTLRQIARQFDSNAKERRALDTWRPGPAEPNQEGWSETPVVRAAKEYLDLWAQENYGRMASFLQVSARESYGSRAAAKVRRMYQDKRLEAHDVARVDYIGAALVVVHLVLKVNGIEQHVEDRWVYQDGTGRSRVDGTEGGSWVRVLDSSPV